MKWTHGVPTASVQGIVVHPRDHDLVIGTHGRAAYILDDIRPLRTMSKDVLAKPLNLFEVPDAQQFRRRQKRGSRFLGDAEFRGENEPYGALFTYSLNLPGLPLQIADKERERREKEREAARKPLIPETGVPQEIADVPKEPQAQQRADAPKPPATDEKEPKVDIEVADASGNVIRKFKGPAKLGVNRASWDLRRDAYREPPKDDAFADDFPVQGPEIVPGTYTVTVKFRGNEGKQTVRVVADPRMNIPAAARQANWDAIARAGRLKENVTDAIMRIQQTRTDIDSVNAKLKKPEPTAEPDPFIATGNALKEKLNAMERRLWVPPKTKGIVPETDVISKLDYPLSALQSSWDAPTPAQLAYLERAEAAYRAVVPDYNKLFTEDVAKYRDEVRKRTVELLPAFKPIE